MELRIFSQSELEEFAQKMYLEYCDSNQIDYYKHIFNYYLWCFPLSRPLKNIVIALNTKSQHMPLDQFKNKPALNKPPKRERNVYELFVKPLSKLLNFEAKTIIDVGCGDFGAMQDLLDSNAFDCVNGAENARFSDTNTPHSISKNCDIFWRDFSSNVNDIPGHDILITNEVAEHIDEEFAKTFISNICSISDVIIFSAATLMSPGDGHINCQKPSYWRNLFSEKNYHCVDIYRTYDNIYDYQKINCFAYISEDFLQKNNLELLMRLPSQYIDWCPPIEVAYMARRYTITQRLISQIASMTSPLDEELRLRFIAQMFPSAAHGCMYWSEGSEEYRVVLPAEFEKMNEFCGGSLYG